MITRITKGASFGGAAKYDLTKDGAELLETNCAGQGHEAIAREMQAMAESNDRVTKPVFHVSLSLADGQSLSDDQWREAAKMYMKEMGFGEGNQFVLTKHKDAQHEHCHLIINRVDERGQCWSDSKDRYKTLEAERKIEKHFGIERENVNENEKTSRIKEVKADLFNSINAARGKGRESFKEELEKRGYKAIYQKSGAGLSIQSEKDKKTWKSSELIKGGGRTIEKNINPQPQRQQAVLKKGMPKISPQRSSKAVSTVAHGDNRDAAKKRQIFEEAIARMEARSEEAQHDNRVKEAEAEYEV